MRELFIGTRDLFVSMSEPFIRALDRRIVRFSCFRARDFICYVRGLFNGMRYVLVIHRRDLLINISELFIGAHDQDIGGLNCFRVPPVFRYVCALVNRIRHLLIRIVRRGIRRRFLSVRYHLNTFFPTSVPAFVFCNKQGDFYPDQPTSNVCSGSAEFGRFPSHFPSVPEAGLAARSPEHLPILEHSDENGFGLFLKQKDTS
jgi:hypothetical protein